MSYLDETLTTGEIVVYRTGLHWTAMLWPLVVGSSFELLGIALFVASLRMATPETAPIFRILGTGCLLVGIVVIVTGWVRRSTIEMAVTNRRVLMKSGLLARRTVELLLTKVESIGVDQDLAGRMAGYGTVVVRGTGGTHEVFERIDKPLEFRRQVQEQIQGVASPGEGNAPPRTA